MEGRDAVCEGLQTAHGYVVAFPAGTRPCAHCRTRQRPLVLRGWVRVTGLGLWQLERRHGAYVCRPCARRETTRSLLHTALLGWLGIFAVLFHAPRATFHNWRAVYTHPRAPQRWGAVPTARVPGAARRQSLSPLRRLSRGELKQVEAAHALYERVGAAPGAGTEEIRAAFRARAKLVHPDAAGLPAASEQMARLNEAWEILGSERLRAAYDWLERERVPSR